MPARDETRLGEPVWADLMTSDTARSVEFYTQLFGWTTTLSEEYGNYTTFWKGDAAVAGLAAKTPDSPKPDAWCTYLGVADADATVATARDAGAEVLVEPKNVGEEGRVAVLLAPDGSSIGIWQAANHTGFGVIDEVGAPVWHELHTRDFAAALPFYGAVFDWKPQSLKDTDEFRYSTFGTPRNLCGGVYDANGVLPEGVPSHWQLYLGVPDVQVAADRAKELGGTVVREPWVSEFGTFAQIADPTGAMFQLG